MDAAQWNERYAEADLIWSVGPNQFVEAEVTGLPLGRALDLAAGEGRNAIWLAGLGWQVTAVDFSDVAIDKGRRIAEHYSDGRADRITWVVADVTTYRPPGEFDLVVVAYLQLAAAPRRRAIAVAARGLAPGGTLIVIGHDSSNIKDGYGGPQDPDVLFTPADIVADLAAAESSVAESPVAVIRADRVERHVQTDDGDRVAIDALVRAAR